MFVIVSDLKFHYLNKMTFSLAIDWNQVIPNAEK